MSVYKITSELTNAIEFEDRVVGVPSESELSDEEAAIASKVANLEPVEYAKGGKVEGNTSLVSGETSPEQYVLDKHVESNVDQPVGDDVVEEAPTKLGDK